MVVNHLAEWNASCVDQQLTQLNVTPLDGYRPLDYLLYSDTLPRRNDGRVCDRILKRYQHLYQGGWWCSGIDILTGLEDLWGCFKPVQPRLTPEQKMIKYEHPPQTPTGIFALRVSQGLWEKIATRYRLSLTPDDIQPEQPDLGFWSWVINHPELPVCITEGAKKAGALLTAGYIAIALPGINSGYRVTRDQAGNRVGKSRLIPQLQTLATPQRQIYLVFDQDRKPNTIKAVDTAIKHLGYLLTKSGCSPQVVTWNSDWGKGVDDLISTHGQTLFDQAYQTAKPLATWRALSFNRLTYPASLTLNSRYLPPVSIPSTAKLIGIKSAKGTGKTQLLEQIVQDAANRGQSVLVISHRIRLVEALCQRLGLEYLRDSKTPNKSQSSIKGYGLCIDSLHPGSRAKFNPNNWSDCLIIIDEVEQVLWHGLNSETCRYNRVSILKSIKTLMQNIGESQGQVVVADADLSDISLEYLLTLAGNQNPPFIIQNDWKPNLEEAWSVHNYSGNTPKQLVKDLEQHIAQGGKPFICLSAQKLASQWGTCTLESYLKTQFPDRKILRIDSESLADPTHPAYGCIHPLNSVLKNYDIVLASPSIETGVNIDIKGHFTSVWGIAQGIQSENCVRQALGRIRENLPRFIWVASLGFNSVGNGSTSIATLLGSGHRLTRLNIRLLQQSDFETIDDIEMGFQAESLLCWAKMAVRFNAAMNQYRESVLVALEAEGHQILDVPLLDKKSSNLPKSKINKLAQETSNKPTLSEMISAVRDQNYQAECEKISQAPELSHLQYQILQNKVVKIPIERRSQRKYELKLQYGIPITPDLVMKDDRGWYNQLRIHYFLTLGRPYLGGRDALTAQRLIEQGEGSIFVPDFNQSQLGAVIGTLEFLGVSVLIKNIKRDLKNTDEDLKKISAIALRDRTAIKSILGIGLAKNSSPIMIIRRLLDKIGYRLECTRSERQEQKRIRVYQVVEPNDGRFDVFQHWLMFEGQSPGKLQIEADQFQSMKHSADSIEAEFTQLCLKF